MVAIRCQRRFWRQVPNCNGNLRSKAMTAGISASNTRLLLHSQTTGSQAAKFRWTRSISIRTMTLLMAAWVQ